MEQIWKEKKVVGNSEGEELKANPFFTWHKLKDLYYEWGSFCPYFYLDFTILPN